MPVEAGQLRRWLDRVSVNGDIRGEHFVVLWGKSSPAYYGGGIWYFLQGDGVDWEYEVSIDEDSELVIEPVVQREG